MQRALTVVPFRGQMNRRYLYDDNTGMVFPSAPATEELLEAHRDAPLDAAAASLAGKHSAEDLAAAREFVERWETRFGAFYRGPEYGAKIEQGMLEFSRSDLEALIAQHAWVQLVIVLTEDCNLRCTYCYYSDAYPLSRNRASKHIALETGRKALDYFFSQAAARVAANPLRKLAVNFYGGEPMLAQRTLRELTRYAKEHSPAELVFAVTTNGTLLAGDIADFLVENDFHILVSLDGPPEEHDRNRVFANGRGSFDLIEANLREFRRRYPDYRNIHHLGVFDWRTDLERVNEFHEENAGWLPPLQMMSQANDRDSVYYERFTEEDRQRFGESHRRLEQIYLDAKLSGKPVPSVARAYFELRMIGVLLRRRQGNLPFPILPVTATCVPGSKLAVRADGTFDICERINGTMPIGDADRGLDFGRIEEIVKDYNREVCGGCWECPVTKLCGHCFASCNADGKFEKMDCRQTVESIRNTLGAVYSILDVQPNAFADLSAFNPELQILMR